MVIERFGKYRVDELADVHEIGRYRALDGFFQSAEGEGLKKVLNGVGKNVVWSLRNLSWYVSSKQGSIGEFDNVEYKRINLKRAYILYHQFINDNPQLADKVTFQEFVSTREGQMRAMVVELRILLGTMLAVMLIGLVGSDDNEDALYKRNYGFRMAYKVARKTLSELSYFYSVDSLEGLLNSGFPLLKTFSKAASVVSNGWDESRDWVMGENSNRDQSPFMYYSLPFLIPGFQGLRNIIEPFSQDEKVLYDS
jgi:hypothetical protein